MLSMNSIRSAIEVVAAEYGVKRVILFGSYATGKNTPNSDVDLLVEFNSGATLLTLSMFKLKVEELLGVDADVIGYPLPKDSLLEIEKVVELYAA